MQINPVMVYKMDQGKKKPNAAAQKAEASGQGQPGAVPRLSAWMSLSVCMTMDTWR